MYLKRGGNYGKEKIEKFNEMVKEAFKNYDHQRKIDVCDYFNKTNGGDMEKTKVMVDNSLQDFSYINTIISEMATIKKNLEDIAGTTEDKLLYDISEHIFGVIEKCQKQLNGYVRDNYEITS